MHPPIHWTAIALRLTLTVLAGGLLGADRSRNGHPAGLRTVRPNASGNHKFQLVIPSGALQGPHSRPRAMG
ncbi:MAG: MgtC/SapB family protein [Acidobacteriaceae bacterium]